MLVLWLCVVYFSIVDVVYCILPCVVHLANVTSLGQPNLGDSPYTGAITELKPSYNSYAHYTNMAVPSRVKPSRAERKLGQLFQYS